MVVLFELVLGETVPSRLLLVARLLQLLLVRRLRLLLLQGIRLLLLSQWSQYLPIPARGFPRPSCQVVLVLPPP